MPSSTNFSDTGSLYHSLRLRVGHWVYTSCVSSWQGQEDDIIADIVQEAISRTFRYAKRADLGETPPLNSFERVSAVIAYHCFVDLRRRNRRLVRFIEPLSTTFAHTTQNDYSIEAQIAVLDQIDPLEIVLDSIYNASLFEWLASEIVRFPDKQRRALLIDLSNRMHFGAQPTPLQQAFLRVGIRLQDYMQPIPDVSVERSRHASLLSLAYKRLKKVIRESQPAPTA